VIALLAIASCAYVTKDEFLKAWDPDHDGWPAPDDCAPEDSGIFPFALDKRGDGCDTDCGTEDDADGDDWPDAADCFPDDALAYPCSLAEQEGDAVDTDCGGQDGVRTDTCAGLDPDFPPEQRTPRCDADQEGA
jgi:hypothetical protein